MYPAIKRFFDIIFSLIVIILFFPFGLLIAICIAIDEPGPIFADIPLRVGLNGRLFFMFKFRSMVPQAHKMIENGSKLASVYKSHQGKLHLKDDFRITRVGRILRRFDLDEFPQFINVLLGNMSVVGPRPLYKEEFDRYCKEFPKSEKNLLKSLSVRPGITGPWQVSGRNSLTIPEKAAVEAEYVRGQNFLYDFIVILKTPIIIFTRFGAVD